MFKTSSDPLTGRTITKLSPDGVLCHHPYFYNRMFSSDSRHLLYSQEEEKQRTIRILDLETGESRLLVGSGKTGAPPVADFSQNFSSDGKSIFYNREGRVIRLELDSGNEDISGEKIPAAV